MTGGQAMADSPLWSGTLCAATGGLGCRAGRQRAFR